LAQWYRDRLTLRSSLHNDIVDTIMISPEYM
jgi:hypothetical protein